MKGIIVDKKGRHAVVLTGDGSFIRIHNNAQYKPGYEIEFEMPYRRERSLLAKASSIAAAFLFTLGLSYGVYSYTVPYSYVDLDINPSIELTANVYDIIIKTETFNKDGEKLLKEHKLNFKKLDAGIAELVDSAIQQGYLKAQTENAVLLTVASKDEQKKGKLEKHVEAAALEALNESRVESAVISQQVTSQKRDAAKDMGISPGKFSLIERAITDEPELKLDDLKDASVKEIMKHIKENSKEEKTDANKEQKRDKDEGKQDKEDINQDGKIEQDTVEKQDKENIQDKEDKEALEGKQDKEDKQYKDNKQDKQTVNSNDRENRRNNEVKDSSDEGNGKKSDNSDEKDQKYNKDEKHDKENKGSGREKPGDQD